MTPEQKAERLKAIEVLRDPSTWPVGFEWSFESPATCAIGLFRKLSFWSSYTGCGIYQYFEETLGLPEPVWRPIFSTLHAEVRGIDTGDITAAMVAEFLEATFADG